MTIVADPTLLDVVRRHAGDPALLDLIDPAAEERTWVRLPGAGGHELWAIAWPAGSSTDWHDHGEAAGAFVVIRGALVEHTFDGGLQVHDHAAGAGREFGAGYAHDVRNESDRPALSLHAYAPRLSVMNRYRFRGDRLELLGVERAGARW